MCVYTQQEKRIGLQTKYVITGKRDMEWRRNTKEKQGNNRIDTHIHKQVRSFIKELDSKIGDKKFLRLINKIIQAGYIRFASVKKVHNSLESLAADICVLDKQLDTCKPQTKRQAKILTKMQAIHLRKSFLLKNQATKIKR